MMINSLMYHDVVESGNERASGFAGAGADLYKLDIDSFKKHLAAIAETVRIKPSLVTNLFAEDGIDNEPLPLMITFDDGGRSAYTHIADALEERGWRGHFFVATDFIDTPTFMSQAEIRELRVRGHVIGSHSASHPLRMAACTARQIDDEWRTSVARLGDILGEKITVASVPGGHFSKQVALGAAKSGIETLFNSEPVRRLYTIENCRIVGRFSIQRQTTAAEAAALASGAFFPRSKQYLLWNAKKIAKKLGGEFYLGARKRILSGGR